MTVNNKMKRYEKYKPSGVEWIGDIPEHWETLKLGYASQMIVPMRDKPKDLTGPIPWLRIEDFDGKYVSESKSNQGVSEDTIKEMRLKVFPVGTVLCSCSCSMGKTAIVKKPLITNQTFIGIVPFARINSDFLYYLMQTSEEYLNSISSGAIQTYLSREEFERLKVSLPILNEQTAIANYLDEKTAQIDTLVVNKQKLIELLKEERTAIINHAVTKGINPKAKLKPSGIEWLDDIPEHWEVKRLKYLSEIKTGEKNTEDRVEDGMYPFFVRSQEIERINSYSFEGEAILTAGDGVGVAKVFHYYNGKFDYHQRVYGISHFKEVIGKYLFYYLKVNLIKEILRYNAKSTVDSLRLPMFQNFMIGYPKNVEEQTAIIQHIETHTSRIDATIFKIEKEIELMQEYRTALVSEVVTGKIKVS